VAGGLLLANSILMRVLLTGATGFVGREVRSRLRSAGHSVRILARKPVSPTPTATTPGAAIEVRVGDILNESALTAGCAGVDAVIHLVGIISEVGIQTFENIHTRGTGNVVRAARRAGVRRFIHMSALGAKPGARARYHQTKWAAEEIVRSSGLDYTIFRPSIIYGPGDGFVNLFAKISRESPVIPLLGGGVTKFQPIPVESVADAFVRSLPEPRASGQTYDLCGAETLSLREIVDAILAITGRKRLKVRIPWTVARLQAAACEFIFGRLLRRPPPLNRDQVLMLQEDNVGDGQAAADLFKLQPGNFRGGIARYLK
jgi:uncharacterized protein YbjT (DUF2867 family)